jgi:hypothetical protein
MRHLSRPQGTALRVIVAGSAWRMSRILWQSTRLCYARRYSMILTTLRQWHTYVGLFIAPSVLFFSLTGAVQIFNLHEAHGSYHPAVLLEKFSAVHKDQVFEEPHDKSAPDNDAPHSAAGGAADQPSEDEDEKQSASTLALKWFFLAVALGLAASTLIGIWMGTTQTRRKGLAWSLLIVGGLVPVGLLVI